MYRMTHERTNGIKTGYWSPNKKEELVQRLAAYENTGLEPRHVQEMLKKLQTDSWIPVEERLPDPGLHVLISFKCTWFHPVVAHLSEMGRWMMLQGAKGFDDVTDQVYAWRPMPDPYRPEEGGVTE